MPNVSITIKYDCKLYKIAAYVIVLHHHGDRIDRPGNLIFSNFLCGEAKFRVVVNETANKSKFTCEKYIGEITI